MSFVINTSGEQEHGRRTEAMIEHLQHRAVSRQDGVLKVLRPALDILLPISQRGHRQAQHDEAHVVDRTVSHQPLDVILAEGGKGPQDHAQDRQDGEERRRVGVEAEYVDLRNPDIREERDHQPQETVSAQLQHDTCQQHRACRRRFAVRIRQPGVERPDRHFDGEGDKEGDKGQPLDRLNRHAQETRADGARQRGPDLRKLRDVEGRVSQYDRRCPANQLRRQQEAQRAAQRVDNKLGRGILPVRAAPLVDQEVHRHQAEFPEEEEDHQVQRDEDAHQPGLEKEDQGQVHVGPVFDLPTDQHGQRGQDARQQHQHRADAVNADVPGRAQQVKPAGLDLEHVVHALGGRGVSLIIQED